MNQPPYPPGRFPPGPFPPGPPPGRRRVSGEVWHAFLTAPAAIGLFVVVNVLVFLAVIIGASSVGTGGSGTNAVVAIGAGLLGLVAVGGLVLAVLGRSFALKGLGIGLAIGWALVSIVSAGYCTGLSPELYAEPPL